MAQTEPAWIDTLMLSVEAKDALRAYAACVRADRVAQRLRAELHAKTAKIPAAELVEFGDLTAAMDRMATP